MTREPHHEPDPSTRGPHTSADGTPLDAFQVTINVTIRPCRAGDLPTLEWLGLFTPDRDIIRDTYDAQVRGDSLMLVAQVNREPVGQLWIDLARRDVDGVGVIWAGRVFPCLRGLGIGTRLFALAERILRERGFTTAELSVDHTNLDARRLYERLGYRLVPTRTANSGQITSDPIPILVPANQWLMRKRLAADESEADTAASSAHVGRLHHER